MKKLLVLFLICFSGYVVFAGDNLQNQNNGKEKSPKTDTRKEETGLVKACTVTVTQYGTATGLDCNGVFYNTSIPSTCTKYSSANCETAFVAADNCASTNLSAAIAAYNTAQQNCN